MRLTGLRFFLRCGAILAASLLSACGGGGGGSVGSAAPPAPTYSISGSVSGLTSGTLVLQVAGKPDVNVTANGNVPLATGVSNGGGYAVSVRTQPAGHECTVSNGSGNVAGANVSNVQITCTTEVRVSLSAPASNTLVPVNTAQSITASIGNITADRLTWSVLPAGMASNVTLVQSSTGAGSVAMNFTATAPGNYTVRVTAQTDNTKTAQIDLRVHQAYTAIDAIEQRRTFLRADGRVVGTALGTNANPDGAPADQLKAISQGWLFRVGIRTNGTVVRWGAGGGNGTTTTPGAAPTNLVARHVAAGHYYTIAIREDGTLAVWGRVNNIDARIPTALASTRFIAADVTLGDFAAIQENGTPVVWDAQSDSLKTLPGDWQGRSFTRLCATQWHVVAVDATGTVRAWNAVNNGDPELNTPPVTTAPVTAVYCGTSQAVLVQEDGRVRSWGVLGGASTPLFDSSSVSGFPRIKGASIFIYGPTYFLSESGAVIDAEGNVVTAIDSL